MRHGPTRSLASADEGLSTQAFGRLARLVHRHSRVRLGAEKRLVLANRLRARVSELGLHSGDAYARYVESARGREELDVLIDLATTHYTRFYREAAHFEWLQSTWLPHWLTTHRAGGSCRIWSAATSSGEEAWTLAVLLAEAAAHHAGLRWELCASDISGRMLAVARRAIYAETALEPMPTPVRHRHFERGIGPRTGSCRVGADLRRQVKFIRASLFDEGTKLPSAQDVIFCRNVMIYFDIESRAEAVRSLARRLAPGGHLIVGASESLLGIEQGLQPVQPGIYRLP